MTEERAVREQLADFCPIVDKLGSVIDAVRKAFTHQNSQLLAQLINQQEPLCREIGSDMRKMNELAAGKLGGERDSCLRLHSILTHIQIIAEMIGRIEETLRKQIKDGVLFSDKAISQVNHLFYQQTEMLHSLSELMQSGDEGLRHRAIEECKKLGQSCIQFATDHESRLVEGLCYPQGAPFFLAIIDYMQTIIHHDLEVARILGNEF